MEFGGAGGARRGVWRHGCGGVAGDHAGVAAEVITPESLEVIPPESQEPEEVVTPDLEMEVVPDSQMEAVPDSITPELQMAPDSITLNSIATVAEAKEAESITTDSMPDLQMAPDSIATDSIVPDSLPPGDFLCGRCGLVHEDREAWNRAHSRFRPCRRCGLVHADYMSDAIAGRVEVDCDLFIEHYGWLLPRKDDAKASVRYGLIVTCSKSSTG